MSNARWKVGAALLVTVAAGLAVPAWQHLREQPPPPPPVVRLAFSAPPGTELGSGDDMLDAAISPDERQVVFVGTRDGTSHLWRRRLEEVGAERLEGTSGAQLPRWDPAGNAVAFFADGQLKRLDVQNGKVEVLADAPVPAGAAWMPDGSLLFAGSLGDPIQQLANGGRRAVTELEEGDRRHVFPAARGARGDFVYVAIRDDGRRVVRLVTADSVRDLTTTSGHADVIGGRLVHVRDGALVSDPIEMTRPPGPRATLGTGVGVSASGRGLFAASPRVLLYAPSAVRAMQIEWMDPVTGTRTAVRDPGEYWRVRLSPTDRHVAVTMTEPLLRTLDVVTLPTAAAGDIEKVSLALAADTDAVWSPDASQMLFRSLQTGRSGLVLRRAHRSEDAPESLPASDLDLTPTDWRGSRVLAHAPGTKTGFDLWELDERGGNGRPLVNTGFNETDGRWSPDGRWVVYVSDESGRPDIYATFLGEGTRVRVSFAGGVQPRWSRDGGSVFFLRDGRIMHATLERGARPSFAAPRRLSAVAGIRDFDVAHTSARLLLLTPMREAQPPQVTVVLDWASLIPSPTRDAPGPRAK